MSEEATRPRDVESGLRRNGEAVEGGACVQNDAEAISVILHGSSVETPRNWTLSSNGDPDLSHHDIF